MRAALAAAGTLLALGATPALAANITSPNPPSLPRSASSRSSLAAAYGTGDLLILTGSRLPPAAQTSTSSGSGSVAGTKSKATKSKKPRKVVQVPIAPRVNVAVPVELFWITGGALIFAGVSLMIGNLRQRRRK